MRLNIDLTQGKEKKVFFTSDFHLFHNNVLKFDNRPFDNVHDMHVAIEQRWNEVVGPDDIVIYLGDLSFARKEDKSYVEGMMHSLNGEIHFVMGNHDKWEDIKKLTMFESQQDYLEVRITHMQDMGYKAINLTGHMEKVETLFCCSHYPIYSWNKKHHGSYMIHGHCHGNLHHGEEASFYDDRRVIDVGCMLHDYYPISHSQIIKKLSHISMEKPNERDKIKENS
jgi:calcineurin-like phosphoesterase family protein